MTKSLKKRIFFLVLMLVFAVFLAITKGSVRFSMAELLLRENRYIVYLRIARILMAVLAGSGLAVSGIALQAILKNSLAEPYILGTSSGAGLGAVLAIVIGIAKPLIPLTAFIGAILTIILVYNLARQGSKVPVQSLILSGIIVSISLSAIIVYLVSTSSNEATAHRRIRTDCVREARTSHAGRFNAYAPGLGGGSPHWSRLFQARAPLVLGPTSWLNHDDSFVVVRG